MPRLGPNSMMSSMASGQLQPLSTESARLQDAASARANSMSSSMASGQLQPLSSVDLGLPSIEEYTMGSPMRLAALSSAFARGPPPGTPV